ncbi:MDR family MFS transporter [Flavobacterium reichenbachii]|uniref:Major facilitator transporter n=1 Tax=Flavobacterium reichenbachii TaxID=362418 RepID=A0A085ZJT9_9FLAO|nr:MFS transporter [Flavobacterium reichenbachii]KFF04703.1 major facilitator transporter [Flavobacterium reichenbachii]OXB09897.1 MFS transporter [Flavobacterium reichenbachii]
MLKTALNHYTNNFKGFSREIWILTIVTFINRAGTMVLPFLSKYLKEDLHFTYNQVGWIMVAFGLGSMLGSWLGGKLSDKIGFYKIMVFSLFTSGVSMFLIQFVTTFEALCVSMFLLMAIADMFRPAMFVSLGAYAKPENRTRALTLVRLAINLGFAAGPALGGLIIMGIGYSGLFWVDGSSCIISILIFALLVKEKKKIIHDDKIENAAAVKSVFHDKIFWVFLFVSFVTAMIFFQLFTTLPLYHNEKFGLTELQTGLIMTLNGLIVFSLEMPTVGFMERKGFPKIKIIILGSFIMSLSFFLLLINIWAGILVISMICISLGEILTFPFSNAFALSRAPRGQEGQYMALYTMSFSLAHIVSSKVGFEIIAQLGYQTNWFFMAFIGIIATLSCFWIKNALAAENVS